MRRAETELEGGDENMRLKLALVAIFFMAVLCVSVTSVMAKPPPAPFMLYWFGIQYQWRAWAPFTDWSAVIPYGWTESDDAFTLTGNVLHTSFTFAPSVIDVEGASTNYIYDKNDDLWIEREGTIDYRIPGYYCPAPPDFQFTSYWRGYIEFSSTPSQATFERSIVYQWVYIYLPQDDTSVTSNIPYAQWDEVMQAWLVGYSIYIYDAHEGDLTDLSWQFVEPVPASNYNPLGL